MKFDPLAKIESPGLNSDGERFARSIENVRNTFSKQAERDVIGAQEHLINAISGEMLRLSEEAPDLSDVERYIVAKRIIKQRLSIYLGQLDQIS